VDPSTTSPYLEGEQLMGADPPRKRRVPTPLVASGMEIVTSTFLTPT
jgi:hypothetical protein